MAFIETLIMVVLALCVGTIVAGAATVIGVALSPLPQK